MKNITLALDEELVAAGRRYARRHHTSLNRLIRGLLAQNVGGEGGASWVDSCFDKMDAAGGRSGGRKWRREELYDA